MRLLLPSRTALALAVPLAALVGAGEGAAAHGPGNAAEPPEDRVAATIPEAFSRGALAVDLRYRYEFADQATFDDGAALDLRIDSLGLSLDAIAGYETSTIVVAGLGSRSPAAARD